MIFIALLVGVLVGVAGGYLRWGRFPSIPATAPLASESHKAFPWAGEHRERPDLCPHHEHPKMVYADDETIVCMGCLRQL